MKVLKSDKDKLELRYEIKSRELQLRIRGLEEEEVRNKMVNMFTELMDEKPTDMDKVLDQVFRLKSTLSEEMRLLGTSL